MNQNTFDTFARRTATLLDRRSLCGGVSAALVSIAGWPLAAKAKPTHKPEQRKETIMTVATLPPTSRATAAASDPIATLRGQLLGQLITPDDPDYDEARHTIYVAIDRRPRCIVRVADAEDVVTAVSFAREHDLPLAVRSGGHSLAYYSVIDDALVVDFSEMKRIRLDAPSATARVQPGATSEIWPTWPTPTGWR